MATARLGESKQRPFGRTTREVPVVGHGRFPDPRSPGGHVLKEIAASHGATARQVALRFLVRRPPTFAIPRASSAEHAADNAGADALRLTDAELARIAAAFPRGSMPRHLPVLWPPMRRQHPPGSPALWRDPQ